MNPSNKIILISSFLLTLYIKSNAQVTLHIGSGPSANNYSPINNGWDYSYTQTVYLASELTAAGATGPGYISKIAWFSNVAVTTANWNDWDIYLGNTSQTSIPSITAWIPLISLTQVFSAQLPSTVAANTWLVLTLTTPFYWNGTSNLVIAIDENTTGSATVNNQWSSYNATPPSSGSRGLFLSSNGANINPNSPGAGMFLGNNIAQLEIEFTPSITNIGYVLAEFSTNVYPNPNIGEFTVETPTNSAIITVTDIFGQLIFKKQVMQKSTQIQLNNNGVYIVYIKTNQGTTTRELIVNR